MNDTNRSNLTLHAESPESPAPEEIQAILTAMKAGTAADRAERDSTIILLKAQGIPVKEIAATVGVCKNTVHNVTKRNAQPLEQIKTTMQRIALAAGYERIGEMSRALLNTATNEESRNQASAARTYGELVGLIGKPSIHIGDVNTANVTVDLGSKHVHTGHDPELEAKLRAELVGD